MSWPGMPVTQTAAPTIPTGTPKKPGVNKAAEALKALRIELAQFGMTEKQIRLDNFRRLEGANAGGIRDFAAGLEELGEAEKKLARVEGRLATEAMIAGVIEERERLLLPGEDEFGRRREDYYLRPASERSEEQDAAFERELTALENKKRLLGEIEQRQAAMASAAGALGSTITNLLLAPMQEGFQGLKTILEMVKAAFLDLIATIMQELAKGIALKFLSSALGIPLAGEAKGLFGTLFGFKDGGKVEVANGMAIPAFAGGGKRFAPGGPTGDGGLARFSDEEWFIRARAGRYYGDRLMSAINGMRIPRAALEAAAGGSQMGPAAAGGAAVHYHIASLDPLTALDMMREVAAPALGRHLADGSVGLLAGQLRTATATPRAY